MSDPASAAALVDELEAEGWDGVVNTVFLNDPVGTEASIVIGLKFPRDATVLFHNAYIEGS